MTGQATQVVITAETVHVALRRWRPGRQGGGHVRGWGWVGVFFECKIIYIQALRFVRPAGVGRPPFFQNLAPGGMAAFLT